MLQHHLKVTMSIRLNVDTLIKAQINYAHKVQCIGKTLP